jgi:hypothetical protein
MKIWWLFGIEHYYPSGGIDDLLSTHHTEEEAKAAEAADKIKYPRGKGYHYEIVNVAEHLFEKKSLESLELFSKIAEHDGWTAENAYKQFGHLGKNDG